MDKTINLKSLAAFVLGEERLKEALLLNITAARKHHSAILDKQSLDRILKKI